MRLFTTCSLLLLFVALVSCQRQEADADVIVSIPPEFSIDLFEQRDSASGYPTLGLWVESTGTCNCSNCGIGSTVQTSTSAVAVKILGVSEPNICQGPAEVAKQFIPIGNLPDGVYAFSIALGASAAIVNKGVLHIQAGSYRLDMPDVQGIEIGNYTLQHIPDHYIWGFAAPQDSSQTQAANDFLRDLKNQTSTPALAPGFYGYFTVSGTGSIALHRRFAPQNTPIEPFMRKLDAPLSTLRPLLKGYRNAGQGTLQIRLLSTEGEI